MTDNGSQATIDQLMELVVAYGLPPDYRASFRAALEVYAAMAIPSEVAEKPPATRSQALRAAGFATRERMTGAGGLMRDKFKDEDPQPVHHHDAAAQLAELRAVVDRCYQEFCGRDFMHLPLDEAIRAAMKARVR